MQSYLYYGESCAEDLRACGVLLFMIKMKKKYFYQG